MKKNIVNNCIINETKMFRTIFTSTFIMLLLFAVFFEIIRGGFALGLHNVKTIEQLNTMVSKNKVMNVFPDSLTPLGIEVPISKTATSGFSILGSGEVQAPLTSTETVVNYEVYLITIDNNAVYLLSNDKQFESNYKKRSGITININACDSFKDDFLEVMSQDTPQEMSQYTKCYVAYGYKYTDHRLFYLILIVLFLGFELVIHFMNDLPMYQKNTKIGKQIQTLAHAKGVTYEEMCNRINQSKDKMLYQNGDCIITLEYFVISYVGTKIRDKVNVILPVENIQEITILPGEYADEFNEIKIKTLDRKSYQLTIHQSHERVEEIVHQCLKCKKLA